MLVATLNMFLLPAVTYAAMYTNPCSDWCVVFVLWSQCWIFMVITIHVGLRGYAAFIINVYFGAENIFVPSLNQYHKYVCSGIATGATPWLTLWFFWWSRIYARRLLKGAFIWHLNNQSIDIVQIFHHASVEMYEFLSHNRCLDIQLNVLLQYRSTRN